jgi:hypothetical protein
LINFSNVVLGEYVVSNDPDCQTPNSCLPPVQHVSVSGVKLHENWNPERVVAGNDIALLRLAKPALFSFVSLTII